MPTLRDVARRAGVSPMTVSRVVNRSGPVSDAVRERVEQALAETGYLPNTVARNLRARRTDTIGLLIPDMTNPFFTTLAHGVEASAREAGISLLLANSDESEAEERRLVPMLLQRQVDGLLLIPAGTGVQSILQCRAQGIPLVIADRRPGIGDVDVVRTDSEAGALELGRLLVGLGHRRMAVLSGPASVATAADRVVGFSRALAEGGHPPPRVLWGAYSIESGRAMALEVMWDQPPTALFAANNFIAIGVLHALESLGLRVPEDVAVVGFDDLPAPMVTFPFLTVAAQPAFEMGRRSVALLLDRLVAPDSPAQDIVLPTRLVIRRSSGDPVRPTSPPGAGGPAHQRHWSAVERLPVAAPSPSADRSCEPAVRGAIWRGERRHRPMTAAQYAIPSVSQPAPVAPDEVVLVASGDLRHAANVKGWPAQQELEANLAKAFAEHGIRVRRGHEYDPEYGHGFIWNQRTGMDVFAGIHPDAPIVVAEAVWQYTHHVLAGLRSHRGPILTAANWSGQWPGLVGLLNLNASMTKAGVPYSSIWSEDFTDDFARRAIGEWIATRTITHDTSHVRDLAPAALPAAEAELGRALAAELRQKKAVMGVFDEGCMGMYNAIFDDEYLNPTGIYKERLSQSALYARMRTVRDDEAEAIHEWLVGRGMRFLYGTDEETELTRAQVIQQLKMYIAAVRIAHDFGCAGIGIQYQQGLKDLVPASDLAEGLLNERDRPPVYHEKTGEELYAGRALPHFNEVDWGAGVDALVTNRVWTAMGFDPSTTLHDVRWGDPWGDDFVWVFEISGSVPPSHLAGGYAGTVSERQAAMYFALGGGTIKGVSKPGDVVWSRVFLMDGKLQVDIGRATAIELPAEETERRWQATSSNWPIMHAVLHGVTRDQFMARHRSNHIQVVYAPSAEAADRAVAAKAAMYDAMGVKVHLCGAVLQD